MLPQASGKGWYSNIDAFRSLPKDLTEATITGAGMTVVAMVMCAVLFLCEASAFLTAKPRTSIVVDTNEDISLRINFDVTLLDINCEHATVGLWDAFGTEKMNVTRNVQKQRVDHKGIRKGYSYTEDEIAELEFSDRSFTKEELAELDSDWGSTSDKFQHSDFEEVINAHDFTFINFYADWCPHCKSFAPQWKKFQDEVGEGRLIFKDADGVAANVHLMKMNCVDFEETCANQKIRSFPTIRLYKRGDTKNPFEEFNDDYRNMDDMKNWVRERVMKKHLHAGAKYHEMFSEGCRLSGHIEAYRVPGTVHFQAMHTNDRTVNLAYTNVSHVVHHFSFGNSPRSSISSLPAEYRRHVNPLDGRTFVADKFHQAPHHFVKVVHTRIEARNVRSYQQTHQWSVRTLQRTSIPRAKFSYDLSPVEVVVTKGERRWYDFVTQVFAIVGGTFSVMSMMMGMVRVTQAQLRVVTGKKL